MSFINSLPPTVWTFIVISLLGVIATFIYKILIIDWKMRDLEPIRKNADEISKIPEEIRSVGNRVATLEKTTEIVVYKVDTLEKTTATLEKTTATLEKTTATLEKTTEHVVNKVATLEKTTATLEKTTERVVNKVAVLENTTESISRQIAGIGGRQYTEASSPMSLNNRGKELSKEMDAARIASKYKAKLVDKARDEDGGPYQIQESCFDCAAKEILKDLEEKDKETFRHLTDIAYNEGVQIEIIMRIVGLVLRDQVLQAIDHEDRFDTEGEVTQDS